VTSLLHAVAKISGDLILLTQHGEVSMRSGRSSSMPSKRNPFDAVHATAAARAGLASAGAVVFASPHELQRAAGAWHAEWWAIPQMFECAAAALEALGQALGSIEVHADVMFANLETAGLDPTIPDSVDALLDGALHAFEEEL
jgi:3-carboxy-cis,cis-muconate cycloisomerase